MTRTDENGRELQVALQYMVGKTLKPAEMQKALKRPSSTYYNRIKEDDFPDADECLLVAEYFDINPVKLLVSFGLMTEGDVEGYLGPPLMTRSTTTSQRPKLGDLHRRNDVGPV